MFHEFPQIDWDDATHADCRRLIELAVAEDLGSPRFDWTTAALVNDDALCSAAVVARSAGVACGLLAGEMVCAAIDSHIAWQAAVLDGQAIEAGTTLATISGPAASLLAAERIVLNFVGRLSGIATLTARYVAELRGTAAQVYDTRKTTPGWRRLEKYAVRCGGGTNHRLGLDAAVLIKDNHLAIGRSPKNRFSPAEAVRAAQQFVRRNDEPGFGGIVPIEIEVDTLEQLREVLPAGPDIVLLDNMSPDRLRESVALRDKLAPQVRLEASGGVNLGTIAAIAATGVERISVGALTHSAPNLDVGLDWR